MYINRHTVTSVTDIVSRQRSFWFMDWSAYCIFLLLPYPQNVFIRTQRIWQINRN